MLLHQSIVLNQLLVSVYSLMIADMAPHPNAAKLLIKYMMEEDSSLGTAR